MRSILNTSAIAIIFGGVAFASPALSATDASYCDAKWTTADADNDGAITQDEATEMATREFAQIDTNGSGAINKSEYMECMNKGSDLKSAEAPRDIETLKQADTNGDGSIDKDEFRQASEKAYTNSRSATDTSAFIVLRRFVWLVPDEAADALKDMSKDEAASRSAMTFSRLDQNDDDTLSEDEWATKTTAIPVPPAVADANFARMDADSNGEVTQEEYSASSIAMPDDSMQTSSTEIGESEQGTASSEAATVPVYLYRFSRM
jgi:Ca2+-binding EF-hand superfamily protein